MIVHIDATQPAMEMVETLIENGYEVTIRKVLNTKTISPDKVIELNIKEKSV